MPSMAIRHCFEETSLIASWHLPIKNVLQKEGIAIIRNSAVIIWIAIINVVDLVQPLLPLRQPQRPQLLQPLHQPPRRPQLQLVINVAMGMSRLRRRVIVDVALLIIHYLAQGRVPKQIPQVARHASTTLDAGLTALHVFSRPIRGMMLI